MWYIRSCTYEDLFRTPSHSSAVSNLFLTVSGYKSSKPRYPDPMRSSGSGLSPNLGFLPFWADAVPGSRFLWRQHVEGFPLWFYNIRMTLYLPDNDFWSAYSVGNVRVETSEYYKYQPSKTSWEGGWRGSRPPTPSQGEWGW